MTVQQLLEITAYRAPLAVLCTDSATGALVGDSLQVLAWPLGDPSSARQASRSPVSPLLGFGDLPGLSAYERASAPDGQPPTWSVAAPQPFLVSVIDQLRRYLPELIQVDAPVASPMPVTLYSAPARPAPPGWACVRGEIHSLGTAAAWSLTKIDAGAASYFALADDQGRFLLYLPYPEALPPLAGSPPAGPGLADLTWPLSIWVWCEPSNLQRPTGADPPELRSILGQARAGIITDGGTQYALQATLTFGAALILSIDVIPA